MIRSAFGAASAERTVGRGQESAGLLSALLPAASRSLWGRVDASEPRAGPRQSRWADGGRDSGGGAGKRVGCVFCVAADATTAQLRIHLVNPSARGYHEVGRLVDECVSFARRAGYERMRLWTKNPLGAARKIYLAREFKLVAEDAHQSFGAEMIGQVYEFDLRRCWPERAQGPCRPQA
jgi:hypothetical protein